MEAELILLLIAAFGAGFLDAVVGGGGLIQLPALFSAYPALPPATLLGTSKLAGVWGTLAAVWRYARTVRLDWHSIGPAMLLAPLGAWAGARAVSAIPPEQVRMILPFVLGAVAVYTLMKKDLGQAHQPRFRAKSAVWVSAGMGLGLGFYDGLFGPGVGSVLIFVYVRLFGFDFLHASASAKLVNVACNIGALIGFGLGGHLLWKVGLLMGACNVVGSLVGSHTAIAQGSAFVRKVFIAVLSVLIVKIVAFS
ncbi:sulfite exporter TauE/SafE family protein [Chitinimonas lacunae]|uniref:Probable membrane transporter protein n=1 Tax=Chitinimonas lacunae TaxID=1963018 RepID=A0ABV8MT71_9NEIS